MSLGGNIINNAQGSGTSRTASSYSPTSSLDGGNGVQGEVVRPQFRGVSPFSPAFEAAGKESSLYGGGGGGGGGLSEYGGGPLGMGSRSQPKGIIDSLMGSFLGSSLTNDRSSPISSVLSPSYSGDDYGGGRARYGGTKQGSNIGNVPLYKQPCCTMNQ